jgi:uncharacterized protein
MLLVDANVLLHAVNLRSPEHELARTWLDRALEGPEPVAFSWLVLLAFLRIATRHGIFANPLAVDTASDLIDDWLARPAARVIEPTPQHAARLRDLLVRAGTAGNLVSDAHLAALALEYRASIVSFDRDFARFPGIRAQQPVMP